MYWLFRGFSEAIGRSDYLIRDLQCRPPMEEKRKILFPCELTLLIGLILVSLSVCLFIRSGFGVTVIASVPLMISYAIPELDFGTWNIIYTTVLIFISIAITRKPSMTYLFSMVEGIIFGIFLNIMKSALADIPKSPELDVIYLVVAHILLFFGVSCFMRAYIPLLPPDLFIRDVVITYRIKYRRFKTFFDVTCLVISITISLLALGKIVDLGIGTVISACITGFFVSRITTKIYDRYFEFRPVTKFCERFLSDDAPCKSK